LDAWQPENYIFCSYCSLHIYKNIEVSVVKISKLLLTARGAVLAAGLAVAGAAAASDAVVDADWLAARLDDGNIRIVEVSVEPGKFERAHIPGAVNFRWHTDLVDPVRRDIASRENWEKLLSSAGITPDTTVVLYGDHNNWFAAWGAWIFRYYGHADVKLLDGGRNKWEADNRPLGSRPARHATTDYKVGETHPELRARLADVLEVVNGDRQAKLLDIRSPAEFEGKIFAPPGVQELAIRAGHVPGAKNVPWGAVVREDGTFKPAEELRQLYAGIGIDGSEQVIVYCRIGERSAHSWFVLSQILGYDAVQYDGSWTEYGNAVGVPIANPAGTVWGGT
jgi:thiosulfate/3-mercaptopyruvate sulfurtransferase